MSQKPLLQNKMRKSANLKPSSGSVCEASTDLSSFLSITQ